MSFVSVEPGPEGSTSLSNVHLSTFTRKLVYAWSCSWVVPVFKGLEDVLNLVGCCAECFDALLVENALNLVRSIAYVGEGDRANEPCRLTMYLSQNQG